MNKKNSITIVFFLICLSMQAQDRYEAYTKPLKEVLGMIEERYDVAIECHDKLSQEKNVTFAAWRFRNEVETTLYSVLGPLDYFFTKKPDGTYLIQKFQYHVRTPEEGKKDLDRLAGLASTKHEWEARRALIKRNIKAVTGWPLVYTRNPLDPIFASRQIMNGYSVEHVAIETLPGVYLAGSLYKPIKTGKMEKRPGIAVPQGHFPSQRFSGDSQKLCATLARMGAVVFTYDMFAFPGTESELQFNSSEHKTPFAGSMQIWNCSRVIDFLADLPDINPDLIGMTGCSGGATQTFISTAIDDRIKVSALVAMVSSWFYGGCQCETGLPVHTNVPEGGTNNVEIAAMAAPRPMLVVSNGNDWTFDFPETGLPFIERVYAFYGKTHLLENMHLADEFHDFGPSKRIAVYSFMARHLGLDLEAVKDSNGQIDESFVVIQEKRDMLVFGVNGERLPGKAIRGIEKLKKMVEEDKDVHKGKFRE